MKKPRKNKRVDFLMEENLHTFMINTANVYANGNISAWIRHCILNYEPKYIFKDKKKPSCKKVNHDGPESNE